MNTCEAVHEGQHQNLSMPAVQTVQYEFKHTQSFGHDSAEDWSEKGLRSPDYLLNAERESRDRGLIVQR